MQRKTTSAFLLSLLSALPAGIFLLLPGTGISQFRAIDHINRIGISVFPVLSEIERHSHNQSIFVLGYTASFINGILIFIAVSLGFVQLFGLRGIPHEAASRKPISWLAFSFAIILLAIYSIYVYGPSVDEEGRMPNFLINALYLNEVLGALWSSVLVPVSAMLLLALTALISAMLRKLFRRSNG